MTGSSAGLVRPAVPADAEAIAAVHVAAWRSAYAAILPAGFLAGLSAGEFAQRWQSRLAAPAERFFALVFEQDGQVLGFTSGGPSREGDSSGEVYTIYVDPARQGQGAGSRLLNAAAGTLAESGFTAGTLWVFAENHPARGFYEAQGWRHDGTPEAVKSGTFSGVERDEVRYDKPLAS